MHNFSKPLRLVLLMAIVAFAALGAAPAAMAADTHPVPACGKHLLPNNKHCTAPAVVPEITVVVSTASCTVAITGSNLLDFEQILLDFNSLLLLDGGVYQTYLAVYPPGDSRNQLATAVTVSGDSASGTITVYNPAICGKQLIVTTALFSGGTIGTSFYGSGVGQEDTPIVVQA